jgi:nicotinate-nucleotide pyrophosphorylase (carboxylating)
MKIEPFGPLDPALYREIVRRALAEDLGWGDATTLATVPEDRRAVGRVLAKQDCVIAGLDVFDEVFRQLEPVVRIVRFRNEGDECATGDVVCEVEGRAGALLTAERTALNFLQRLSGIATMTRRYVRAAGGRITVLDTRKTTPTLRVLEKYAVRAGGGTNHRNGLDDGILIKDNHKRLAGGIAAALDRAREAGYDLPVEVETETLDEVDEALAAGATRILVDNFDDEMLVEAVRRTRGRAQVEVSGGVTLERLPRIAESGAECVSIGALTHSAPAIDLSFELELPA